MPLTRAALLLPTIWLLPNGTIQAPAAPRLMPGVEVRRGPNDMTMFTFDGRESGILFPDSETIAAARSLTISAWILLRERADTPGQLVFRGDDRNGNDAFALTVHPPSRLYFSIWDHEERFANVHHDLTIGRWTHVTATLDDFTGEMSLEVDGKPIATTKTTLRPRAALDLGANPGIGIGNIQNIGPHNQPFSGALADVRIYPFVTQDPLSKQAKRP